MTNRTLTLYPTADGDLAGLYYSDQGANIRPHYTRVNEVSPNDATWAGWQTGGATYGTDLFILEDPSISVGTITAVKVYTRTTGDTPGIVQKSSGAIKIGGSVVYGTERNVAGVGWTTYEDVWSINPVSGVAWTWQNIRDLQAGCYIYTTYAGVGHYTKCSQVYVVVYYTTYPPNTPSTPSGVSRGVPGVSYSFSSTATDPDGDNIYYVFDWGDTTQNNTGWLASGQAGSLSHSWSVPGTYLVKVYAVDTLGEYSGWSATLSVLIVSPSGRGQVIGLW